MPDLPDRDRRERELTAKLSALLRSQSDQVLRDPANIPWDRLERELAAGIVPELAATQAIAAENLASQLRQPINLDRIVADAQQWAERYAVTLAAEVVRTTRDRLTRAAEQQTAAELAALLLILFGDDRAYSIGVTETTRAATAGERGTVLQYERDTGNGLVPIWVTAGDGRVCQFCAPLDEQRSEVWERIAPGGPPAHPRCRCFLRYEVVYRSRAA